MERCKLSSIDGGDSIQGLPGEILEADLNRRAHQRAVVTLSDAYAMDPMGNGKALSAQARRIYTAVGFSRAVYVKAAGGVLFFSKPLQDT